MGVLRLHIGLEGLQNCPRRFFIGFSLKIGFCMWACIILAMNTILALASGCTANGVHSAFVVYPTEFAEFILNSAPRHALLQFKSHQGFT